jgi:hypothetical protein
VPLLKQSRLLTHWRVEDGFIPASDGSYALRTFGGLAGVFSRTGDAYTIDSNGRLVRATTHKPRILQIGGEPYLLLEGAGTNLCLQSENFGTTWVAGGTPDRVAAAHTKSGVTLDLIGDDSGAGTEYYEQNIAFTGATVKAVSVHLKASSSASVVIRLHDFTAGVTRLLARVTWSGETPVVTMTNGIHLLSEPMIDGVYRLYFQTTAITPANTNTMQVIPASGVPIDGVSQGYVYAGGVQVENSPFPTSYQRTTTGTVTRSADSFYLPFNALPREMTVYAKFIERGSALTVAGERLFQITDGSDSPPAFIVFANGSGGYTVYHDNGGSNVSAAPAATPGIGRTVEFRAVLNANGSVLGGISIDGAAEVVSGTSAANALAAAWAGARLYLNRSSTTLSGYNAFRCVKVAAGVRTLAEMRSAW